MDSVVDGVPKSGTQPSNFRFTAQLPSEFLEVPYIFLFLNSRTLGDITVFYIWNKYKRKNIPAGLSSAFYFL